MRPLVTSTFASTTPNVKNLRSRGSEERANVEMPKTQKCAQHQHNNGSQALIRGREFYPLAFETHGRTGKSVLKLLGRLAALTDGSCGLSVRDMLLDLHVNMVKGSAECARIVAARAMKAQNESRKDIE